MKFNNGSKTSSGIAFAVLFISVLAFVFAILYIGQQLYPNPLESHSVSDDLFKSSDVLFRTLLALFAVLLISRILGLLCKKIGHPPVIGEIVGGLLLGPSGLGAIAPSLTQFLFPVQALAVLSVISQIGVLLYMFLIGLEIDLSSLRQKAKTAFAIAHAGIAIPLALGVALSLILFPYADNSSAGFLGFAIFIGVSLSITAFPVLARILNDLKMNDTPIGQLALACAAMADASAWCLLALVVGLLRSSMGMAFLTLVLTALYVIVMIVVVRPLARKFLPKLDAMPFWIADTPIAYALLGLLASALATEWIGIHAIFGGFLLGAVIPHNGRLSEALTLRLQDLVKVFFLPAFFIITGMKTQVGLLNSVNDWLLCGLIILVAILGKFGGTFVAARISGLGTRDSSILGTLMNARGLVELIVLNIGLELKILNARLFAMFVLMTLVTTIMTGPILKTLRSQSS